jgi:hypothetical protein
MKQLSKIASDGHLSENIGVEKLPKIIYEPLPAVKLYLDDLQEITSFLMEHYGDKIELRTTEYKISNVDNLPLLKDPRIKYLRILGGGETFSDVEIEFKRDTASIFCRADTPFNRGVVEYLKALILKRERYVSKARWLMIPVIAFYGLVGIWQRFIHPIQTWGEVLAFLFLTITFLLFTGWFCWGNLLNHSIIIPNLKKDVPSFWQRNKDQIWLVILGGVLGALLTVVGALLFGK